MLTDWKKKLAQAKPKFIAIDNANSTITDEKLVPGRIIEIELSEEDGLKLKNGYKKRRKYIVIISVDNDRVIYASFLINTDSYDITDELANLQYPLFEKDYPKLLKHKSYLDCSYLLPIDRTRLKEEGKDKGTLTQRDLEDAIQAIKDSKTIEPKTKKIYNLI